MPQYKSEVCVERHLDLASTSPRLFAEIAALRTSLLLEPEGTRIEDYRHSDARSVHFVARFEDLLAGYVQYDPELNRLRQMLVMPEFRRRGIGRLLVTWVKSEAARRGRRALRVHAWTASRPFYRRVGFEPCGDAVTAATMPWQPMAIGVRPLSPATASRRRPR